MGAALPSAEGADGTAAKAGEDAGFDGMEALCGWCRGSRDRRRQQLACQQVLVLHHAIGFGAGFANGVGSQMVSGQGDHIPGRSILSDVGWAGLDGMLGAGENPAGTGMSTAAGPGASSESKNMLSNVLGGVIGMGPSAFCAVAGQSTHDNWNC